MARVAGLAWKAVVPHSDGVNGVEAEPRSKHQGETTMDYYAGIDVSLECSSVCVVDTTGKIIREAKVASEPQALIDWFHALGFELARIGLEAGPLSQWLYAAMMQEGLAIELLETRHVRDAFKAMTVKSDRNDARNIAQLMRLGWFRPVHCKSLAAQEVRAMLTARKLVQSKLLDVENSLRGILRGFGLKVGKTTKTNFASRIEELVKAHPNLKAIAKALLRAHAVLLAEFNAFEKRVRKLSALDAKARLLMSTPAVGSIVSLTFASTIDDPSRFTSSKKAGPLFGLTPKKYQSGETDYSGRISKTGDASVREALYEAAHIMLTKPLKGCSKLKSWAMQIAKRAGLRKAKVALARKLSVIMLCMLKNNMPFNPARAA
ncbi:IS110 family transposase [Bradyrhizobium sp.]|uniref:IS110 family transposase n=1 Tax=Bradyrhizobium sp. TaxID=376 RepID=UPI00387E5121